MDTYTHTHIQNYKIDEHILINLIQKNVLPTDPTIKNYHLLQQIEKSQSKYTQ